MTSGENFYPQKRFSGQPCPVRGKFDHFASDSPDFLFFLKADC